MGTKGRDLALYSYFFTFVLIILGFIFDWGEGVRTLLFVFFMINLSVIIGYQFSVSPNSIKQSRENGFKILVLVPVGIRWAEFLIKLSRKKINSQNSLSAYEIHLVEQKHKLELKELLKLMEHDLKLLSEHYQGDLILWETHVPLPSYMRKIIKTEAKKGNAFWEKGSFPIPKPPFTYRRLNTKRARYGAGIIPGKGAI